MDLLSGTALQALAAAVVFLLAMRYLTHHYRRCPHCRRVVPRAHRGWLRCRHCGRQYHRSVQFHR